MEIKRHTPDHQQVKEEVKGEASNRCEKSHEHIIPQLTQRGKGSFEGNIMANAYLKTEDKQTTAGII